MSERTRRFVGRKDILERIHSFAEGSSPSQVMVITGEPGCGKSALMARFAQKSIQRSPDRYTIVHFVGASPASTNIRRSLIAFCTHLTRIIGSEEKIPEDYNELVQYFPTLIRRVPEDRQILFVIDAVNQLEQADNAQNMRWLPQQLPSNVKFVVSTLAGEALDALSARGDNPVTEKVPGLDSREIEQLVNDYLKEIRHEFPNPEIRDAFFEKIKAGSPLYITVALEELRLFPSYEALGERIRQLPETVARLFDQVLERIEGDHNPALVRDFTAFMACGKHGMTAGELQTLLKAHPPVLDPGNPPEKLPDMLFARLRRSLGEYLFERSGVIDFFHTQLKQAVGSRYLPEAKDRRKTHQVLADYFERRWREPYIRALDELPHQLIKAENKPELKNILSTPDFTDQTLSNNRKYELMAYWRELKGDYEPGPCYLDSMKNLEAVEGETTRLAYLSGTIAEFLWESGVYPDAEPLSQRALKIYEKALGGDHPEVAPTLNNLAGLYYSQGKYEQAEPLYQRALKIRKKALGGDHPSTRTVRENLKLCQEKTGNKRQNKRGFKKWW